MDNQQARELFEDNAAGLQNVKIIGGSLSDDHLVLQLDGGFPDGRYAIAISATCVTIGHPLTKVATPKLEIDFDEPAGAGADPYGRPDPKTHPEFWRE